MSTGAWVKRERDSLLAHGAAYFLKERLTDLSDAIKTAVCGSCGCLAIPKSFEAKVRCDNCNVTCSTDEPGKFGQITIPYAYSLLRHLIAGLNIELRFAFGNKEYTIPQTTDPDEGMSDEEILLGGGEDRPDDEDENEGEDDYGDDDADDYGDDDEGY